MARRRYYFSDRLVRRRRNIRAVIVTGFLVFAVSAGSGFDVFIAPDTQADSAPLPCSSHLFATDSCLPPLKSIRHIAPDTVADETQRPAGKPATT
jgi:hypothetical protein